MGPRVGGTELVEALLQAGKDLLRPYSSTDSIFDLLNVRILLTFSDLVTLFRLGYKKRLGFHLSYRYGKVESLLVAVDQDPILQVKIALKPSMQALVSADLLRNPDSEVRVYVVSCLAEIMRITAPEAPYNDDQMKEVFEVTVEAFGKLAEPELESYKKAEAVLDTFAKLTLMWFTNASGFSFVHRWSPDCPQPVLISMETIMVTVLDESEQVSIDLLKILLGTLRKEILDVSPVASRLVEKVVISCACKLGPDIMEAFKSTGTSLDMYSPVVSSICQSKASLPSKVGQTNQPVVISLSPSSKARKGSRKRSRSKMEETNKSELGEELVGKSVKVWWPLDKK
ncbi:hypothetical protein DY000_02054953 [Brassica cretica]|uniref:Uncharacterized protein n=1 Tax=Brassica cretica TaxID=69181 RepID=A0ABQ7AGE9_BRACR|nr:hypothetical protein DY000_02054953 [Brassica cretica]